MTGQLTVGLCTVCHCETLFANDRGFPESEQVNRLEAGKDEFGRAPLIDALNEMETEPGKRKQQEYEDQLINLYFVLSKFLFEPDLLRENEMGHLYEGLWEIKASRLRIPIFGVPCTGTPSSSGNSRTLVLPKHAEAKSKPTTNDRSARATHLFPKRDQKTTLGDKRRALKIMRLNKERVAG